MARVGLGLGLFGVIFEAHSYWHYECEALSHLTNHCEALSQLRYRSEAH